MWILGVMLSIHSLAGFYYVLMPMGFWIDYQAVEPAKPVFMVNEELHFVSSFITHRPVTVTFNDILFCDTDDDRDGFHRYAQSVNKTYQLRRQQVEDNTFPLPIRVETPATCYLSTTVVLELPLNIDRFVKVNSSKFEVK